MSEAFDTEALLYDDTFTKSPIGIHQRRQVWQHVKKTILRNDFREVFEVNCGTGEDALFLRSLNCKVTATDISPEMIAVANAKIRPDDNSYLDFHIMDAKDIGQLYPVEPQDVIFSNFGGLNCLSPDELEDFISDTCKIIKPGGSLVLVLISKKCLWEKLYLLLKRKEGRRNTTKAVEASLGADTFHIWYYSKKELQKLSFGKYQIKRVKPIGLFIPPSYLNHAFKKRKWILTLLAAMDWLLKDFGLLGDYADHIYVEMKKI